MVLGSSWRRSQVRHSADNPQPAPGQLEGKKASQLRVAVEEMRDRLDSDSEVLDLKGTSTQRNDEVKFRW